MADSKKIQSDLNRVKAQLEQLEINDLFTDKDRERLRPIYKKQIETLETHLNIKCNYENFINNRLFA